MLRRIRTTALLLALVVWGSVATAQATTDFCADVPADAGVSAPAVQPLTFDAAEFVIQPDANDYYACIVTSEGIIEVTLFDDDAPESVNNFVFLATNAFYDGVVFHRVVDDFVIQGGDRNAPLEGARMGTGGPGYTWGLEPGAQELRHGTGTLAQARAQDPDSNGSQFYITLAPQPSLNGQYNVYGQVSGDGDMDVAEAVQPGTLIRTVQVIAVDAASGEAETLENAELAPPPAPPVVVTTNYCDDVAEDAGVDEPPTQPMMFEAAADVIVPDANDYFACLVTSKGVIELTLFDDNAPESVNNFVFLAQEGFYDGVSFHRVVDDFVIQGGDRNAPIEGAPAGTGGAGYLWSLEPGATSLVHETGTLAQARAQDPNSNGSQFYITLAPQPSLNGQYNVYGQVSGDGDMDVVLSITQGDFIRTVQIVEIAVTGEDDAETSWQDTR